MRTRATEFLETGPCCLNCQFGPQGHLLSIRKKVLTMTKTERYYDLDWLRVTGMLLIFLFHTARFFNFDDWHVKNYYLDYGMSVFVRILDHFIMPFFFVLSALAIFHALRKRSSLQFLQERVSRLLVPLVFGIFSHVILQVYLENLTHGRFSGTFWQFIPSYFDGWYGFGGNFAWMGLHLWYLLMLFLFSALMLPLFQRLRSAQTFTQKTADLLAKPFGPYLFIAPIFLVELLVSYFPESIGRQDFGGWSPLTYLVFFLIGYLLATDQRYRMAIQRVRLISLISTLLTVAAAYMLLAEIEVSSANPFYLFIRAANAWSWLLTFLGFASKHLNMNNPVLKYANQAVLPFYILHQTVIVVVGYFIKDWPWPILPKYAILAVTSFTIIVLIYEAAIKRSKSLRFLFGMKI